MGRLRCSKLGMNPQQPRDSLWVASAEAAFGGEAELGDKFFGNLYPPPRSRHAIGIVDESEDDFS